MIAGPQPIQSLHIDIGQGRDWWVTRLFFLSSLAADLTSVETVVFVEGVNFIGMIHLAIIEERPARTYSNLKQYEDVLDQSIELCRS